MSVYTSLFTSVPTDVSPTHSASLVEPCLTQALRHSLPEVLQRTGSHGAGVSRDAGGGTPVEGWGDGTQVYHSAPVGAQIKIKNCQVSSLCTALQT